MGSNTLFMLQYVCHPMLVIIFFVVSQIDLSTTFELYCAALFLDSELVKLCSRLFEIYKKHMVWQVSDARNADDELQRETGQTMFEHTTAYCFLFDTRIVCAGLIQTMPQWLLREPVSNPLLVVQNYKACT